MSASAIATPSKSKLPVFGVPIQFSTGFVIPPGIGDLDSFRHWALSHECPEKARVAFFDNQIWMDPTLEEAYTHNHLKAEATSVLRSLAKQQKIGRYFANGMVLTSTEVGFTTIPDGLFVSFEALATGRVVETPGADNGCIEFVGTPDMVLEVVSRYSVQKDERFISQYFEAGILEYWLIDVRREPIRFDIFRRNSRKFVVTRKHAGGWLKSLTFGRSFRLTAATDQRDEAIYSLEVRPS